ncbi:hypothetical protein RCH11_000802 [Glaciihabitans sp. GrIS 2.15]|nr:hypothetical protein [Glaciihabitans sp. GrIS 2.15]
MVPEGIRSRGGRHVSLRGAISPPRERTSPSARLYQNGHDVKPSGFGGEGESGEAESGEGRGESGERGGESPASLLARRAVEHLPQQIEVAEVTGGLFD